MLARITSRLSYANVVATLALFLALGGGAYAAFKLPKNSVGTKQIKNGAVTTRKLHKGAVTAAKVAKNSLTGAQIRASTLGPVPDAALATTALHVTSEFHATVEGTTVVAGSPGVSVLSDNLVGHVPVAFPVDISKCSPLVSALNPNTGGSGSSVGFAMANAPNPSTPRQLDVYTFDKTGAPAARDFAVTVLC